jgi:hypothetical protein
LKYINILFVITLLLSCKKDEIVDPCLLNPLENIEKLKSITTLELKHNLDSSSIQLFTRYSATTMKVENYFLIRNGSPILKYNFFKDSEIINCNGVDIAEYYKTEDYVAFFKTAKYIKRIWKKERTRQVESTGTCGTLNPLVDLPYFVKLNENLDKYAWKSLIYQYKYKEKTVYYGIYTPIDRKDTKYVGYAVMDCDGINLQEKPDWNQIDFLNNAILERQIR